MQRFYQRSTVVLGSILCVVGIALVVSTLARGGGPLAVGVIAGVALGVLGALRVRMAPGRDTA